MSIEDLIEQREALYTQQLKGKYCEKTQSRIYLLNMKIKRLTGKGSVCHQIGPIEKSL